MAYNLYSGLVNQAKVTHTNVTDIVTARLSRSSLTSLTRLQITTCTKRTNVTKFTNQHVPYAPAHNILKKDACSLADPIPYLIRENA